MAHIGSPHLRQPKLLCPTLALALLLTACSGDRNNRDLLIAVHNGDLNAVNATLHKGANPNYLYKHDGGQSTPLGLALRELRESCCGEQPLRLSILIAVLGAGANPNAPLDEERHSPLHWAIVSGQPQAIKALLDAGANPNSRDAAGQTPLFKAQMFKLQFGGVADILSKDPPGPKALRRLIELMLAHGADINALDNDGNSIMHVWGIEEDPELVALLIAKGLDPARLNKRAQSPIHLLLADIANHPIFGEGPQAALLDVLLTHSRQSGGGEDLDGNTPLLCLFGACNVNVDRPGTMTLGVKCPRVHEYSRGDDANRDDRVLENIALDYVTHTTFLDRKNHAGLTPILAALESGRRGTAAILIGATHGSIQRKSNTDHLPDLPPMEDVPGDSGLTASDVAAIWNSRGYFGTHPTKPGEVNHGDLFHRSPLIWAAKFGSKEAAQRLIAVGADILSRDKFGASLFHFPAMTTVWPSSTNDSIRHAVNRRDGNEDSPLYLSVEAGNLPAVQHLVSLGADINADNQPGECPRALVSAASAHNAPTIIEFLAQSGADLDLSGLAPDQRPVYIAVDRGYPAVLQMLLTHNAQFGFQVPYSHNLRDGELEALYLSEVMTRKTGVRNPLDLPGGGHPSKVSLIELARDRGNVEVERILRTFGDSSANANDTR